MGDSVMPREVAEIVGVPYAETITLTSTEFDQLVFAAAAYARRHIAEELRGEDLRPQVSAWDAGYVAALRHVAGAAER